MNFFLRFAAYLFHPLLLPLIGTGLYFGISPRYIEPDVMQSRLLAVAIITLFIPVVTFFMLKNIGIVKSIHLRTVEERKFPLMAHCLLLLLIIKMVFDPYESPELYYFFVGILFSTIAALIMVLFKFKVSLHQMGIAGLTMFIIALGVHFKVNLLLTIGLLFIANGWVASSRLHTRSHNYVELVLGLFTGLMPQLILLNFWL
jgi:membrane-associated HD superfamily phosphohydrolase